MIARTMFHLRSWIHRRAIERACPELRRLRLAKAQAQNRHGKTKHIEARQAEVMNRALGWRGR